MLIGEEILKYRDEIIHHTCELVKIPSTKGLPEERAPFGKDVSKALDYVLDLGQKLGLKTCNVDGYAGHVEFGEGDGLIGVLVHLDVVPEGNGWTYPPYGARIEEGRIYGRGTCDDKGPAIAALYSLKALKDLGISSTKRVRVIFGTNEESGMKDMEYYFQKEALPDMGFSPDAGYPIINREKGIMRLALVDRKTEKFKEESHVLQIQGGEAVNMVPAECKALVSLKKLTSDEIRNLFDFAEQYPEGRIKLEQVSNESNSQLTVCSKGKSAHGASPSSGINAIAHIVNYLSLAGLLDGNLLDFLHKKIGFETDGASIGIAWKDAEAGDVTVNLGTINTGENELEAVLDVRYPMSITGDEIIERFREQAKQNGLEAKVFGHRTPLYVPADHPLIKKLSTAYRKVTGEEAGLLAIGGGTYARTLQNNGVAFGGADGGNVHQPDEYVEIESLMRHAVICTQAIYELLLD